MLNQHLVSTVAQAEMVGVWKPPHWSSWRVIGLLLKDMGLTEKDTLAAQSHSYSVTTLLYCLNEKDLFLYPYAYPSMCDKCSSSFVFSQHLLVQHTGGVLHFLSYCYKMACWLCGCLWNATSTLNCCSVSCKTWTSLTLWVNFKNRTRQTACCIGGLGIWSLWCDKM